MPGLFLGRLVLRHAGYSNLSGRPCHRATLLEQVRTWLLAVPEKEPLGVLFSGGIDSGAVLLAVYHQADKLPDSKPSEKIDVSASPESGCTRSDETSTASKSEPLTRPISCRTSSSQLG